MERVGARHPSPQHPVHLGSRDISWHIKKNDRANYIAAAERNVPTEQQRTPRNTAPPIERPAAPIQQQIKPNIPPPPITYPAHVGMPPTPPCMPPHAAKHRHPSKVGITPVSPTAFTGRSIQGFLLVGRFCHIGSRCRHLGF